MGKSYCLHAPMGYNTYQKSLRNPLKRCWLPSMAGKEPWTAAEVWLAIGVPLPRAFHYSMTDCSAFHTGFRYNVGIFLYVVQEIQRFSGWDEVALYAFCVDTLTGREVNCLPMERRFALPDTSAESTAYFRGI
jgi:hypothetical protein